jgi:hypothetical protein
MYSSVAVVSAAAWLIMTVQPASAEEKTSTLSPTTWTACLVVMTILFTVISIISFLRVYTYFALQHKYRSVKKQVRDIYHILPPREKVKISALEKEIETGFDVDSPGHSKHLDLWVKWSQREMQGLKMEVPRLIPRACPYFVVLHFLRDAESQMRRARVATEKIEEEQDMAKDAIELAAMVLGIYWPDEVAKARQRQDEKM